MKLRKWVAILMAGALALGLTGCVGHLYGNAMTIDGTEISSGLYLMAQHTAYTEAEGKVEDTEKDVLKQKIDGQSATDWIRQRAVELCARYVAVHRLCREKDVTLSSSGQSNVQMMAQYWQYLSQVYTENGISESTYLRFYQNRELANELFATLYAEGGELAVPDEELQREYSEKFGHIRYISVPLTPQTEDGNDYSEMVMAAVQAMVEKLEAGGDLAEVAAAELPAVYSALGREFDPETVADSITTGYIPYETEDTFYPEEFRTTLKGQNEGEYGAAALSTSALLYQVIPVFEEDADFADMRSTVVSALKAEEYEDYLKGIYSAYAVSWVPGAQWFLRPSKVVV